MPTKTYLLLIIFVGVIIHYWYLYLLKNNIICRNDDFEAEILINLCENVTVPSISLPLDANEGLLPKDLCSYLCSGDFEVTCHSFHLNKPYVFTLTDKENASIKLVLKSATEDAEDDQVYWKQNTESAVIPTPEGLQQMIDSYTESFLGRPLDSSLNRIKSHLFNSVSNVTIHEHFWKLIYDHEFLTSILFSRFSIFPNIIGICKSFYATEYAAPLLENPLWSVNIPWKERIKKALELVEFVERVMVIWKEPVHLCDIKHDHFGWKNGHIFFLDLDCVLTDSALVTIMTQSAECSDHEDCSYFDCLGECLPDNSCSMQRQNSNLQVLCNKIFMGNSNSSVIPLYGLLLSYKASDALKEVLHLCSTDPDMAADILIQILWKEYDSFESVISEL